MKALKIIGGIDLFLFGVAGFALELINHYLGIILIIISCILIIAGIVLFIFGIKTSGNNKNHSEEKKVDISELKRKAAEEDSEAQFYLGYCYEEGNRVKQDYEEAVKWFRLSAKQGNSRAQYCLAVCYYRGIVVNKSKETTIYWLKKAAKQGEENAINALKELGIYFY